MFKKVIKISMTMFTTDIISRLTRLFASREVSLTELQNFLVSNLCLYKQKLYI